MFKSLTLYYKKYIRMMFAIMIMAIAYNLFVVPVNLVAGGTGGLGVLFSHVWGINPSLVILAASIIMFLLALFVLDFEEILSTFVITLVFPAFVEITSNISTIVKFDSESTLVVIVFGAIISGIGQGMVFKEGMNVGGLSVLAQAIHKYTGLSVTYCNTLINGFIIILGAFFVKFSMVLYALVYIFVLRYVSEGIILGVSQNKTFKIISSKYAKIEKYIHSKGHDITIYDTVGSYKGDKKKLIMTVVPTSEFIDLRDYVMSIDKKAFVFVTNTYEVGMQDMTIRKAKE